MLKAVLVIVYLLFVVIVIVASTRPPRDCRPDQNGWEQVGAP
jgi:hypothetical protein